MKTVYLASPLGFCFEWKTYRDRIAQRLNQIRCSVLDPWGRTFQAAIEKASAFQDWPSRVQAFKDIAVQIGKANENMILSCEILLSVLHGPELDSGTVS